MAAGAGTALGEGTLLGGRYRLERRIGGGGMATIWLASDSELGRAVAVKVLSETLAAQRGYRARFRREAKLAAGLSHPGLVRVFDAGEEDERPYLVMEYVAGPTLAERIAAGDHVDAERLARDLLGALSHIHDAGIVHRDVKPANVLFDPAGRAKLTDFGIARPDDATRLTQTGEVIGTLHYMAPEAMAGDPATARSDLYAAGVLLAEATGEEATTPELRRLIASLRAADPGDRPASAKAALARLDAPTAPTAAIPGRRRELEIPLWAVLAALAAIAAAVLAVALISGAGSDGGGGSNPPAGATRTSSGAGSTTRSATSTPAATQPTPQPPAPGPNPASSAAPPKEPKEGKATPPGRAKHGNGPPPGHEGKQEGD